MCFSVTASFVASGGLAVVGVATYQAASKKQKILAIIPILFAIQQFLEGFQWMSLSTGSSHQFLAYGYLFFAFLLWPILIPSTIFFLDAKRQNYLRWFIGIGVIISVFLLKSLFVEPLHVFVWNRCIQYDIQVPFRIYWIILYVGVVCGSFLVSSMRAFRWFGFALFLSAVISAIFYFRAFTSVWCFFAAVLSSLIYLYIRWQNKDKKNLFERIKR